MGLARMGSYAGNGSGDIFVAFSTANAAAAAGKEMHDAGQFIGNDHLDGLFEATVQATEEAIVNAMVAARDMQGTDGHTPRRCRMRTGAAAAFGVQSCALKYGNAALARHRREAGIQRLARV